MVNAAERILREFDTIAVVGLSRDPAKAAHSAPASLRAAGYRVLPVNAVAEPGSVLLGERVHRSLTELADAGVPVEVVDVFRPAAEAPALVREAVRVGAKAVWLQQDIVSPEARAVAEDAGLLYVEDACLAEVRAAFGIEKVGTTRVSRE
ncbi:CoA-binding protein [Saccharomonospora saliphila]|uniref:CoA-binding protein n=1 Tax=Saccharomonospora saliphila TaxID=369829 RepID=UPI00048B28F0|nr:CoA-binding protein [Saccharomonospora saliphila]